MLGTGLCRYEDEDGEHLFIRVCLEVPIHGVSEPFIWGVWVSLSRKSFDRYVETCDAPDTDDDYFGWLCNFNCSTNRTYMALDAIWSVWHIVPYESLPGVPRQAGVG
jgi:hypothetical protein